MALWMSLNFQNFTWVISSMLETLHDFVMVWLMVVLILVVFISSKVVFGKPGYLMPDSELLEKTWTIIPIFILFTIAFPSIYLLCLQDSSNQTPSFSVKVIGNQWNWQSETSDSVDHLLDSESLDVVASYESPLLIKSGCDFRVLTVSTDVLHSLGIPSLGVKLDASPGRISMTVLESSIPGSFLGSCYELCGSGHSAMPIHFLCV